MQRRDMLFRAWPVLGALGLSLVSSIVMAEGTVIREGAVITLTREAVLNGVTLPKGTALKIAVVRKDSNGEVRVDVEHVGGGHRTFKALTAEAVAAMTAAPNAAVPDGDSSQVFKVGAQIPLMRELVLNDMVFPKGSVLQVDRVVRDSRAKIIKIDLRETSGKLRAIKAVPVDQFRIALAPDDVTWPDGAVGVGLHLTRELRLGEITFPKGTRFVVTHVQPATSGKGVVRVGLREVEGQKRELESVSVALLKQSGALGTADGAPK